MKLRSQESFLRGFADYVPLSDVQLPDWEFCYMDLRQNVSLEISS
jgi:hypothetical protein